MRLEQLVSFLNESDEVGDTSLEISDITSDSRKVTEQSLFCCVRGETSDGHAFAQKAVKSGAVALLVEHRLAIDVTQVVVPNVRSILAPLAARFFENPTAGLTMVGVTGTNGKTTTVSFLDSIFHTAGQQSAIIGTLQGERTTPDVIELWRQLAKFRAEGITHVSVEVSSHALAQGRVDGIVFDAAIFTNLTQDHLDYHKTMDNYFAAKLGLFAPEHAKLGVVNADDPYGARVISESKIATVTYSLSQASDRKYSQSHTSFRWKDTQVELEMLGEHNVYNALGAATAAAELGISTKNIVEGLSALQKVPGRLERIDEGQDFVVYVDYAHTPDGLEKVLGSLRLCVADSDHRIITVFGCGGDRDASKRKMMGKVASELSDFVVVTSDNPRSENPKSIADAILEGVIGDNVKVDLDRHKAIEIGMDLAEPGDILLIAGKGHETGQDVGGHNTPFDDREVARAVLNERAEVRA